MRKVLERCPTCEKPLAVTSMRCNDCGTVVQAEYAPCPFCRLGPQHSALLRIFVKTRGNVREVQRELGVTYSAARSMLDELLEAMGFDPGLARVVGNNPSEKEILTALSEGRITKQQAMSLLDSR